MEKSALVNLDFWQLFADTAADGMSELGCLCGQLGHLQVMVCGGKGLGSRCVSAPWDGATLCSVWPEHHAARDWHWYSLPQSCSRHWKGTGKWRQKRKAIGVSDYCNQLEGMTCLNPDAQLRHLPASCLPGQQLPREEPEPKMVSRQGSAVHPWFRHHHAASSLCL